MLTGSLPSEDMSSPEKPPSVLVPTSGMNPALLGVAELQQLTQHQLSQQQQQHITQQSQQQPMTSVPSGRTTPADRKRKRKSASAGANMQHTQVM